MFFVLATPFKYIARRLCLFMRGRLIGGRRKIKNDLLLLRLARELLPLRTDKTEGRRQPPGRTKKRGIRQNQGYRSRVWRNAMKEKTIISFCHRGLTEKIIFARLYVFLFSRQVCICLAFRGTGAGRS
jgi:hypothetical protein